jgi:MFS family permease
MGVMSPLGKAGRGAFTAARTAGRSARRAANAGGAGSSGLGPLIELNFVNSAGDAFMTVAMAGSIFFSLNVNQARGQVALYLVITMAPFALVAPFIGPALDRMRSSRRVAISVTLLARALLCWGMGGAVSHNDPLTLLPAAFGVLVMSKAFGVLRSAVTPGVLPDGLTLMSANARASFTGLAAATVMAPVGAGIMSLIGAGWLLRVAVLIYLSGAVLGMRLPAHIDEPPVGATPPATTRQRWRTLLRVGPVVGEAMRVNAVVRAMSGFLILYLAFLLRSHHIGGASGYTALGLLFGAAGAGGFAGTGLGSWIKARAPQAMVFGTLAFVAFATAVCAYFFGLWAALLVAFVGGLGQTLVKLGLDAVVQREIGDEVRSSTFAVSETVHQLVWVAGGLLGLFLSIVADDGHVALAIMAAALFAALGTFVYLRAKRMAATRAAHRANTAVEPFTGGQPGTAPDQLA